MKIKKILTVLLTSVMLLTFSSAAYAADVKPNAIGIGDTQAQALSLFPDQSYTLFLSNATDKDWFKWTNNTGVSKKVTAYAWAPSGPTAYRLGATIDYNDGSTPTTIFYSNYGQVGNQVIGNIYLPPNATIYYVVDSVTFAGGQYEFLFYSY